LIIEASTDDKNYELLVEDELEQKAGEYLYDVKTEAEFVKFTLVLFLFY
jgi:hypothetical protein